MKMTGRFTSSGKSIRNRYLPEPGHEVKIDRKRHLSILTEVCVYGIEVLGMNGAQIGKELGYSREYIRQIISKMGYSLKELKLKRRLHDNNVK